MAGALLAGPIASASVVALVYDNPFNGLLLGVLALALVGSASRLDAHQVHRTGAAGTLMGLIMIGFGGLYPHFLEGRPATTYLFAAATGVVPCPTIALVTGWRVECQRSLRASEAIASRPVRPAPAAARS